MSTPYPGPTPDAATGGPAAGFSYQTDPTNKIQTYVMPGLTIRDAFALAALQGLIAAGATVDPATDATAAYAWADAMLAERV
jgi:hypothetical protein